jgi:hypothetical protein
LKEIVADFFRALFKTYEEVYPTVYAFGVQHPNNMQKTQNIMIVALKDKSTDKLYSDDKYLNDLLKTRIDYTSSEDELVLTDNYAPVEYFDENKLK